MSQAKTSSATDQPMVRMEHISKVFGRGSINEKVLFTDFNLSIGRGQFVSVVGSNGSGKTTLLNLLCGSMACDGGSISVAGKRVDRLREDQRARFIGRVFQDPAKGTCAGLTILENLSLAGHKGGRYGLTRGVNRKRTDAYRAMLQTLGMGLEDRMDQLVGSLSGGQRQALALLISTMTPLDLLILDEHTAALDPRATERVMALTEQLVREKHLTTLMVTHNLKYATRYGDRLLMMHQGSILVDAAGMDKQGYSVDDLLDRFNQISIEVGN